jgi:stearoyl-CoA desaturase (Delta-9 desaturase)
MNDINPSAWFRRIHWGNTLWLVTTPIAALILCPWQFARGGVSVTGAVLLVIACAATNLSITAGYHRLFAHRSYEAKWWVKLLYLLVGAGAFQGSALQWATDHRRHHRVVDTNDDPYSISKGLWYAHVGWLFFKDDAKYSGKYAHDLGQDAWVNWQFRYYVPLAFAVGFGVPALVGWALGSFWGGLLFGGLLRAVVTQHCTFLINSLCHYLGHQPYTLNNSARDSFVMAVLAFGEGYHNFHHQFQGDYRNGFRWYHWDPTKWTIQLFSLMGWTYQLRRVPDAEILRARMRTDQARLVACGVTPERLTALKLKVEEAQLKMRSVREEYRRLKLNMQEQSRRHLIHLKAELKVARLEFKMSCAQWCAYIKTLKALPAYK